MATKAQVLIVDDRPDPERVRVTDLDGEIHVVVEHPSDVVEQSLRDDGRIKGHISTTDSIVIGKEGEIEGEIITKNAIIGGRVRAKVSATGKVVLESKASFIGELKTTRLVIDDGATFEGRCSMQKEGKLAFEAKIPTPSSSNKLEKNDSQKPFQHKPEKAI